MGALGADRSIPLRRIKIPVSCVSEGDVTP